MQSLSGLRVLEVGSILATGFAGKLFVDAGATVTKVTFDTCATEKATGQPEPQTTAAKSYVDAGKKVTVLDHSGPDFEAGGVALSDVVDVVIGSTGDCLAATIRNAVERNPQLIVVTVAMPCLKSPAVHPAAADLVSYAASGFASVNGRPGRSPLKGSGHQASFLAGVAAFTGALAALHRQRTAGHGDSVAVTTLDALLCTFAPAILATQQEGQSPSQQPNRFPSAALATRDGRLMLTVSRPHFWERAMTELGMADVADAQHFYQYRKDRFEAVADRVARQAAGRGAGELFDTLASLGVTVGHVMGVDTLAKDAHLQARGYYEVRGRHRVPGPPFKMSRTPLVPAAPAASPAAMTGEVREGAA